MCSLKSVLKKIIEEQRKIVVEFKKKHSKTKVGTSTVEMMYGGMRGLKALIWDISDVDPEEGIRFRGLSIPECRKQLPKGCGGSEPLPEGILWLLLTGKVPTEAQALEVSEDLAKRAKVPSFVLDFLRNLPEGVHPMSQLSAACTIMNKDSKFAEAYKKGVKKVDYWEYILEDSLNLLGALPIIAAAIYRNTYKGKTAVPPADTQKDWSCNFAVMLGYDNYEFVELLRMYLTIHSDHEGGNVSAHTTHLVGSALSDPYLAYGAGMSGLAGPLHGLANQEVLIWLEKVVKAIGTNPTADKLKNFVETTLKSGQVVPGYGHAVLRKTDPRYICQKEFGEKYLKDDPWNKLVALIYEVVPPILKSTGKIQNPWPNVDAHSGVLLRYYGLKEMNYYTVLFGVSRAIGVLSQLVWSRALLFPIERPKSMTTDMLIKMFDSKKKC